MKEFLNECIEKPWPWWVGGPLIGIFVIVLFLVERKQLGISSSYQYICSKISPLQLDYFKDSWKSSWQFWFVLGLIIGGVIIQLCLPIYSIHIADATKRTLLELGITEQIGFVPKELFQGSIKSILLLFAGGILIGFGSRYANGCTAGHAIMGCAQLSPASILSTCCFFIGGLIATHFILPHLI